MMYICNKAGCHPYWCAECSAGHEHERDAGSHSCDVTLMRCAADETVRCVPVTAGDPGEGGEG